MTWNNFKNTLYITVKTIAYDFQVFKNIMTFQKWQKQIEEKITESVKLSSIEK